MIADLPLGPARRKALATEMKTWLWTLNLLRRSGIGMPLLS